jgi:hypothetical protein
MSFDTQEVTDVSELRLNILTCPRSAEGRLQSTRLVLMKPKELLRYYYIGDIVRV